MHAPNHFCELPVTGSTGHARSHSFHTEGTHENTHSDTHKHHATEREAVQLRHERLSPSAPQAAMHGQVLWEGSQSLVMLARSVLHPGLPGTAILPDPGREQAGARSGQELIPALPQDCT